ncbi:PKD-like domain-containing protein [Butyricimonas hominis]|uniref:PKD-like domain-containing protein n=1 Tax=Butyricimonas hominis TaxID=2763032 RepID=UPI00351688BB
MRKILLWLFLLCSFASCNKDDEITEERPLAPTILLNSETGIYTVKTGRELTISPEVENADNAVYIWYLENEIIGRDRELTIKWDEIGEYYITFCVRTSAGKAEEELKVEVVDLTPPVISLVIPSRGLKVVAGADYIFAPTIQHDDLEGFKIEWLRNGESVSTDKTYTFHETELGTYPITIKASNVDGETTREITVEVVETLPYTVEFPSPSYFQASTDRYTFAGRTVYLTPYLEYFDNPVFEWVINDEPVSCTDKTYKLTPTESGTYKVTVSVTEKDASLQALSQNITRTGVSVTASVTVFCVSEKEADIQRPGMSNHSKYQNKVYEWVPAPGQFIGETGIGGMTGNETTLESANAWAEQRLSDQNFVSLGGFGGYIIVGFDHSIAKTNNDYDFSIQGNAFNSQNGGSNEPGIIWVMQDINHNGLPDDEWYELRGSETGKEGTIQDYAVTYYKPSAPKMNVEWTDSEGESGHIDYLQQYHRQDYYYPAWIPSDSYMLRGTRLPAKNRQDPNTGYWANEAYDWGYADNMGSDRLKGNDSEDGSGQRNGFKIANAMYPDGTSVDLKYIDFIKVQVGVNAKSGWLGEISTEVFSFQDYSMQNQ